MHTHEEALKVLNCSKMTLSRYVKDGRIQRIKKGRRTYYDEHEVATLVKEIDDNKKKYRTDLPEKPREQIELQEEDKKLFKSVASADCLDKVGYQYLAEATETLKEFGIYKDADKEALVQYALSIQNYYKYLFMTNENGGIFTSDTGAITLHPYFKIMVHHQKMVIAYADRLGLNPLSRQKLEIKEKREFSEMQKLIFDM